MHEVITTIQFRLANFRVLHHYLPRHKEQCTITIIVSTEKLTEKVKSQPIRFQRICIWIFTCDLIFRIQKAFNKRKKLPEALIVISKGLSKEFSSVSRKSFLIHDSLLWKNSTTHQIRFFDRKLDSQGTSYYKNFSTSTQYIRSS